MVSQGACGGLLVHLVGANERDISAAQKKTKQKKGPIQARIPLHRIALTGTRKTSTIWH